MERSKQLCYSHLVSDCSLFMCYRLKGWLMVVCVLICLRAGASGPATGGGDGGVREEAPEGEPQTEGDTAPGAGGPHRV